MKITDGKFYVNSREEIQKLVDGKNDQIAQLQRRLDVIDVWAENNLNLHIPYIGSNQVDVSLARNNERRLANTLGQIQRNLWCSECSSTWPCAKIDAIKDFRDFVRGKMAVVKQDTWEALLSEIKPKDRAGQLPIRL